MSWSVISRNCAALAAILLIPVATGAAQDDARVLLRQYKCYLCHDDVETKAGPAFRDVATAYRGNRSAKATVIRVIKRGQHGGGPWHMPPHPEISDAEAALITQYILTLP